MIFRTTVKIDSRRFDAIVREFGPRSDIKRMMRRVFPRVGRDLRADLTRRVRGRLKIPAKEVRHRIIVDVQRMRFRLYGAGKKGLKFVRARWLSLQLGTKRKPQPPTWKGVTNRGPYPRSWASNVKAGRRMVHHGMKGFQKSKAVVFQRARNGGSFRAIRGPDTIGGIVDAMLGRRWVRTELERRMAAEMRRIANVKLARAGRKSA